MTATTTIKFVMVAFFVWSTFFIENTNNSPSSKKVTCYKIGILRNSESYKKVACYITINCKNTIQCRFLFVPLHRFHGIKARN